MKFKNVYFINGTAYAGKSTMAMVLSGIASPNEGEIIVNGEQALVAINTGLNNQLTGLENIELKGGKRIAQVQFLGPGGTGKTDSADLIAKKIIETHKYLRYTEYMEMLESFPKTMYPE